MKVLYLSSFCSIKEYERLFCKYGSISSHASHKFHRLLTRGMIENGLEVETITHLSYKKLQQEDLVATTEDYNGIIYNYLPQVKNKKWNRLYTIVMAYRKLKQLTKENADTVVCVDVLRGELSIAAVLFKIFHNCKMIALVTDVPLFRACEVRKGIRALPIKLKNLLIGMYDGYIFLTEYMGKKLNAKHKPYVIIEGIADELIENIPNDLSQKYEEKVIMVAGLLEKEFGIDELVYAVHKLEMDDIQLHIYGKGTSSTMIKEVSKIDSRIKFFGEAINQKIVEEERKATLLVNPRRAEGEWVMYSFPSKNMEYIASGTPMLAYNLPCIPSEYAGKFLEISEEGIEETLRKCLESDKEEIHSFGLNAQKWILENKNPKKQTESLVNMINELLKKS